MQTNQRPFWFQEALARESNRSVQVLAQDIHVDVCIIGGGFTGLWTAIHLKQKQPSLNIAVIEKDLCGSGASGRNGGCMLTWSTKFLSLKKLYGEAEAIRLVKASEQAIEAIEVFCQKHQIDAQLRRHGTLYTASNPAQQGELAPVLNELHRHGINAWQPWAQDKVQAESGSALHREGHFSEAAASVQPGFLVRGLKRVAEDMGIAIYEQTPMTGIEKEQSPVCIATPRGTIRAGKVVLALNAWMPSLFPAFKNSVVLVSSDMMITKPIPEALAQIGLKDGKTVIDGRTFVHYYRATPDGRLMLGKGGNYFSFANRVAKVFEEPSRYQQILNTAFRRFFPSLPLEAIDATWTGASDRSVTGMPFFGCLAENSDIVYGLGYSGNGVAQSWMGGQILSSLILGEDNAWTRSGLVTGPLAFFPSEPFRWLGAMIIRNAIRRKEMAEDSHRQPFWLDRHLAKLAKSAGKADK
ncbi:FAD-dependent oxidoreductase [Photobacterium galatheae]|uniref:FAD-dependent oxidoreductase n=1 Tax=Photobacterium galatheae TaxID=1654360 RepID=A0A066RLI7_9GAMM|nr:FAD-dependent oxidoreductase [Photobacterium galatheae]KDM91310.1 FAD-dependent oxidoreductase [Photobacterium galatheae]MCM0150289.1 FAD-dependent oxidoreductase [Photobacterium galatheae]